MGLKCRFDAGVEARFVPTSSCGRLDRLSSDLVPLWGAVRRRRPVGGCVGQDEGEEEVWLQLLGVLVIHEFVLGGISFSYFRLL